MGKVPENHVFLYCPVLWCSLPRLSFTPIITSLGIGPSRMLAIICVRAGRFGIFDLRSLDTRFVRRIVWRSWIGHRICNRKRSRTWNLASSWGFMISFFVIRNSHFVLYSKLTQLVRLLLCRFHISATLYQNYEHFHFVLFTLFVRNSSSYGVFVWDSLYILQKIKYP